MSVTSNHILGELSETDFLTQYWQKKPLVIHNALADANQIIEPDELAGLALEDHIESRILIERSPVDWELRHGPFQTKTFNNLPQTRWTLLVQALDHHIPAISNLLDFFRFIPNWRIDDIMASYAPAGGSVGPHYDFYDVFLIQIHGHRRWQLGSVCDGKAPILPNLPVRILSEFQPSEEHILGPGDILYLPPGVAHYGVAQDECVTLSVGFRAPSHEEILADFTQFLLEQDSGRRYSDPDLQLQSNPGWLSPNAVERFTDIMYEQLNDTQRMTQWLGEFLSQTKYDVNPEPPDEAYPESEVWELLSGNQSVRREETSRFIYTGSEEQPKSLFVNNEAIDLSAVNQAMALYLCQNRLYHPGQLALLCKSAENLSLLTQLLNQGAIYFEEDVYQGNANTDSVE